MAITAATPLAEARGLLNDPSGAIYPDAPMIIVLNKVYKELQTKLSALGIATTKEVTSSPITITAGTIELSDGANLPTDLLYPVLLKESAVGANTWTDMTELEWEPTIPRSAYLNFWNWREEAIKFLGATSDRSVLIRYVKTLGSITATTSPILVLNSTQWIAQRSAAVAALTLGSNPTRANVLMLDLNRPGGIWDDLQSTLIKRTQINPVRRRRTRYRKM